MRVFVFVLAVAARATTAIAQPAPPPPDASALEASGNRHFELAEYEQAIADFKQAFRITDATGFLYNIAQAYRLDGECRQALTFYKTFLRRDPRAADRVQARIAEMEACVAKLPPEPVKPPEPVVTPAEPQQPPPPQPTPVDRPRTRSPLLYAGIAAAGAGAIGLGLGVKFGLDGRGKADELREACAVSCASADALAIEADGKAANRNAYIAYGAGGAAVIAGGVMIVLSLRGRRESPPATALVPIEGGAMTTWRTSW